MYYSNQKAFRKKAGLALAAIIVFILVYLVLVLAASALAAFCIYCGIQMIIERPALVTIFLGAGVMGMSVLVLAFLFKFLFRKNVTDRSGMLEITEADAPELFALVRGIAESVHTSFPRHIYITAEVNASVFYDSSLASLLFPVKKNLQIGLGLVNSVNAAEFKAILAHEFGHFSQTSMKLGSYVYHVNQIIYNLLYENDFFVNILNRWAGIGGSFAFFAHVSIKMVKGIQWLMGKVYNLVNVNHMSLSREMEFHADEVAALVAGSGPMCSGLMRLEFADTAYQNLLGFYNDQIADCRKTLNIYPQQTIVMQLLATNFNIPVKQELPQITDEVNRQFNRSRLVIKNQWASHPPLAERIAKINALAYVSTEAAGNAWQYFGDAAHWQQAVTTRLFRDIQYKEEPELLDDAAFAERYGRAFHMYDLDPLFRGFYDSREISNLDLQQAPLSTEDIADLFSEENAGLTYEHKGLVHDIAQLEQISSGAWEVRQFDYNGQRYKAKQAAALLQDLEQQRGQLEQRMEDIDRRCFACCLSKGGTVLLQYYSDYFKAKQLYEKDIALRDEIVRETAFMQQSTAYSQITHNFEALKPREQDMKERIRTALSEQDLSLQLDKESLDLLQQYVSRDWHYFELDHYLDDGLKLLGNAIQSFHIISFCRIFHAKKALLDYQASLQEQQQQIA